MKKIKKFLFSFCCVLLVVLIFYSNNLISDATIQSKANEFKSKGGSGAPGFSISSFTGPLVEIGQLLTYIGVGLLVAATAYLGVQYIISPPDKQAALKEKLIALVVAGVVIFGSYKIWDSVVNIFKDL